MDTTPSTDPGGSLTLTDTSGRTFEILQALGRGGFGEVRLARMKSPGGLDQHVAIKLLKEDLSPEDQAVERLRDEARLLVSLRHPVVLAAHDLVELEGRVALVTEFIEGQDLSACLAGGPGVRMPISALLEVVEQVASALEAAWNQLRVVHRDVKPQNIRIGVHGNVKLLDFGIARSTMMERAAQTGTHTLIGTLRYLAPERFDADPDPQSSSDVFALGCVLYEGATGRTLFGHLAVGELFRLSVSPEGWARLVEGSLDQAVREGLLPEPLRALVLPMLAWEPARRPSAGEVARRCEALVAQWLDPVPLRRWCRERQWPLSPLDHTLAARPPDATAPSTPPAPAERAPASPAWALGATMELSTTQSSLPSLPDAPTVAASTVPSRAPFWWARWAAATALVSGAVLAALGGTLLIAALALRVGSTWSAPEPTGALDSLPVPALEAPAEPAEAPPDPQPAALAPDPLADAAPTEVASAPEPRSVKPQRPRPPPRPIAPRSAGAARAAPAPVAPASGPQPVVPPVYDITLASVPAGAEVRLLSTGELLGTTPTTEALPAGSVGVRMIAPDGARLERTLQIGRNSPRRYTWYIEQDRLESGY